ncbi:MAG: hypothetical protein HY978_01620 [Candidatus Liptonbacteria bacterium]|nr:hypothetical protein [Candidatus Liptonbacteria bacterium]
MRFKDFVWLSREAEPLSRPTRITETAAAWKTLAGGSEAARFQKAIQGIEVRVSSFERVWMKETDTPGEFRPKPSNEGPIRLILESLSKRDLPYLDGVIRELERVGAQNEPADHPGRDIYENAVAVREKAANLLAKYPKFLPTQL